MPYRDEPLDGSELVWDDSELVCDGAGLLWKDEKLDDRPPPPELPGRAMAAGPDRARSPATTAIVSLLQIIATRVSMGWCGEYGPNLLNSIPAGLCF